MKPSCTMSARRWPAFRSCGSQVQAETGPCHGAAGGHWSRSVPALVSAEPAFLIGRGPGSIDSELVDGSRCRAVPALLAATAWPPADTEDHLHVPHDSPFSWCGAAPSSAVPIGRGGGVSYLSIMGLADHIRVVGERVRLHAQQVAAPAPRKSGPPEPCAAQVPAPPHTSRDVMNRRWDLRERHGRAECLFPQPLIDVRDEFGIRQHLNGLEERVEVLRGRQYRGPGAVASDLHPLVSRDGVVDELPQLCPNRRQGRSSSCTEFSLGSLRRAAHRRRDSPDLEARFGRGGQRTRAASGFERTKVSFEREERSTCTRVTCQVSVRRIGRHNARSV